MNSIQFFNMPGAPGICVGCSGDAGKRNNPCVHEAHRRQSISKLLQYHEGSIAAEIHKAVKSVETRRRVSTGF